MPTARDSVVRSATEDERDGSFVERDKTGAITAQGRYEDGKRIEM